MKIVTASPDELIITDRPWLMAGFVWVMGFVALYAGITGELEANGGPLWAVRLLVGSLGLGAIVVAWAAFPFQRIVFDRKEQKMRRTIIRPLARRVEIIALADIKRAKLERSWSESTWMERIALEQEEGSYPLEWGFSGVSRQAGVDGINRWLMAARS